MKVTVRYSMILALVLSAGIFYRHGRSIWVPIKQKITGARTVEQVMETLGEPALLRLIPDLEKAGAQYPPLGLTFIALKQERRFEVWCTTWEGAPALIKTYPFTGFSGHLGPKLKQGDRQIPEGVYPITGLNPNSSYHLSIKVGYPSEEDKSIAMKEGRTNLGGDIFIHGKSVTIGCIPLGDSAIEEVFALTTKAGVDNCRILIAPYDFRTKDLSLEKTTWLHDRYLKLKEMMVQYREQIKKGS
jgi:murein L,D-transpeptidase YafK